jgi:hypothetical protein
MMGLKNRALGTLPGVVLAFVCVFACSELAAARDVALVTDKNSRVRAVKAADLARTIKAAHKWPDGSDLLVILTNPSSPEMRIVAEKLLGLTSDEFRKSIDAANRARATFLVVASDEEVLKTLQGNPTAIALVNVYSINSSVNVSKIDGKLPLEPGYILHSQ